MIISVVLVIGSFYRKLTTRFGVANGCFNGEHATFTLESATNGCSSFPKELIFGTGAITFPILSTVAGTIIPTFAMPKRSDV
jgi:hypothetical protein